MEITLLRTERSKLYLVFVCFCICPLSAIPNKTRFGEWIRSRLASSSENIVSALLSSIICKELILFTLHFRNRICCCPHVRSWSGICRGLFFRKSWSQSLQISKNGSAAALTWRLGTAHTQVTSPQRFWNWICFRPQLAGCGDSRSSGSAELLPPNLCICGRKQVRFPICCVVCM
jgi:hypothetical protein